MRRTRSGMLAVALAATLVFTGATGAAGAGIAQTGVDSVVTPTPSSTPTPTSSSTPQPDLTADPDATVDPGSTVDRESTSSEPTEKTAPPGSEETVGPLTDTESPVADPAATALVPATNLPSLFIDLPVGYTLDDLHSSKDDIPADPDVEAHSVASLVDPANAANNLAEVTLEQIKGRGNFTWTLDKKPYQIKFDTSTPVLGMPAAKTWILLANHADPSLLRNKLAYDLANSFGLAASPDSRFVDLTINGQFLGNYLLTEKVEVKKNRLELQDPGGLLLELDNSYGRSEDFHFITPKSNSVFVLKDAVGDVDEPLPPELAASYADTEAYVNEFESYLYAPDPDWSKISAMIDVESFIRYHFVLEFAENPEITQSSVYFWRDGSADVLHAGPVWDFDIAFANYTVEAFGGDPVQDYNKNARFLRDRGTGWFQELFRNEEFAALAAELYAAELEPKVDAVVAAIDTHATALAASSAANFERWDDVLGEPSIISTTRTVAPTWQGEVSYLRNWVSTRAAHLASVHGTAMPILVYSAHSADIGWAPDHTSGQMVGTSGKGLRLEALDIAVTSNSLGGTIQSRAHVQNIGWTSWKTGDTRVGTTGQSLRLEAVQFNLTAKLAGQYDIAYRVHVQNIGWMPWAMNGAVAGTSGRGLHIEAIQVRLTEKAEPVIGSSVRYAAHVASIGWMSTVVDGAVAGTSGRALAMEALVATLASSEYDGTLTYRAHVQDIGWTGWTDSPDLIGTVGRGLRIEALQISLKGELSEHYSVRYSAHVQDIGWQSWATEGQTAGTTGQAKRVEAVKIELVPLVP
jgi:uncharacterized protein YjdB